MEPDLSGKIALVTGANSGVGKETARGLAQRGAHVVMAVRSLERGEAAKADLRKDPLLAGRDPFEVMRLDVASLADVRRFARDFRSRHERLHVLVNNAGIHTAHRDVTNEGFETTFVTNHLGPFLLTHELLPILKASATARVVTVASEAHRLGRMHWDDLQLSRRWSGVAAYCQSKLANILFAFELARRLEGSGVTSNAVHPGSVRTNWARGPESGLLNTVVTLATPFLISPAKGARTPLHAATAPGLAGVTGRYFVRRKEATPSARARDVEAQRRLWEIGEKLAHV